MNCAHGLEMAKPTRWLGTVTVLLSLLSFSAPIHSSSIQQPLALTEQIFSYTEVKKAGILFHKASRFSRKKHFSPAAKQILVGLLSASSRSTQIRWKWAQPLALIPSKKVHAYLQVYPSSSKEENFPFVSI